MSESCGNLRKRLLDEAEVADDLVQQKRLCTDGRESDSRSTESDTVTSSTSSGSSGSTLVSSDDEQKTASDTASLSADVPIPFGTSQDSLQFHSQVDAWKYYKLRNRHWVYTDFNNMLHRNRNGKFHQNSFKFTIATYNLLAQNLLEDNSYLYSHCGDRYLEWSYRQKQLLAEIAYYAPDIICCQEVHHQHYVEFFCPEMEKLGYQGSFKKRTRAMHDGCATFFKKSSFECEAEVPVEYFVPGVASLDRDNVALLLLLRPKSCLPSAAQTQAAKLCVANTHLLFNPRRGDVKLAQLMKLFAEIDQLTYRPCAAGPQHHNHHPVLICGDMNIEPFSHLYNFIRRGKLTLDGQPMAKLSGQERRWRCSKRLITPGFLGQHAGLTDESQYVTVCQQRLGEMVSPSSDTVVDDVPCEATPLSYTVPVPRANTGDSQEKPVFTQGSGIVSHKFGLDSVYTHFMTDNADKAGRRTKLAREVTTCHTRANCTVDYIFYTPSVSDVNHSENDKPKSPSQTADHGKEQSSTSNSAELLVSNNTSVSQQSNVSDATATCQISDYRLTLIARLQLLSNKEMKEIGQLPNKFISSDHLILAAQFILTSS